MLKTPFVKFLIFCIILIFPNTSFSSIQLHPNETVTLTKGENLKVEGSITIINTSKLNAENLSSKIELNGDWVNDGVFISGDVTFSGTNASRIMGENSFRTFTCIEGGKTLKFEANKTQIILDDIMLKGNSSNKLNIISTVNGTQFILSLKSSHKEANYLNVKDSNLILNSILPKNSINGGNNSTLWLFPIRISGRILVNGRALSGVLVTDPILGSTYTDASGTFYFNNVPANTHYNLTFSKDGYTFNPKTLSGTGINVDIDININATLKTTTIIKGDAKVKNATVEIHVKKENSENLILSSETDENGNYKIEDVPVNSTITIILKKDGVVLEEIENQNINNESEIDINIEPKAPKLSKTTYGLWNGFLEMTNILELINKSDKNISFNIKIISKDGRVKNSSGISYSVTKNSKRDIILNDLEGFKRDSYGIILIKV